MEGVLVSLKKEGSTIATTVVTNDKGEYSFPDGRIDAGKYAITIRAAGYVLDGPSQWRSRRAAARLISAQ